MAWEPDAGRARLVPVAILNQAEAVAMRFLGFFVFTQPHAVLMRVN